jgi:hypothetical protein
MPRTPWIPAAAIVLLCSPAFAASKSMTPGHAEYDDCEANFIAAIGADAYQFSPAHDGVHGEVRLFSVLSYQRAAAHGEAGDAFWRLTVRSGRRVVYRAWGVEPIDDARGMALAEHWWDGRDMDWRPLPNGKYRYTFEARFLPRRLGLQASRYEDLAGIAGVDEAFASSDDLIVDRGLSLATASKLRSQMALSTCQAQQNTPLEPGFGYNFYYGSTHAHSNYSDGGHPTHACSSGNAYGSGTHTPADAYAYARDVAGLDFWLINEHNHLIDDSVTNNAGPLSEAKVRQRYQAGRAAADAASADDSFVGLYGMEWGVSSNSDQGHVTLIETPVLFGWETCSNCNGAAPECTPGTNCYFDVFTPKRYGYLTMYQRSVENPSPAGALGIFAHPGSGEFDNYAFNANADAALQGIAVRSGLAFSTAENCADANVGATDYSPRWREALNRGFHLGPVADHDSHCVNYGQGIPTRTVYLIPNATAPVLTKQKLLQAHKARHFFASEDPNAQLVFATSDGTRVMGDIFTGGATVTLRGAVYDPNGDAVSSLELWRGQVGAGALAAPYRTFTGSSFSAVESPGTGTWYYFVHAVQADGHDLWSAPMWITFSSGGCSDSTAPAVSIVAPAAGATISCSDTVVQVAATDATGVASVEVQVDGGAWTPAAFNGVTGRWEAAWASASATSGSHSLAARATDSSSCANVGSAAPVAVTVANTGCGGGGSALAVAGWRLTQANSTYEYTLPAGTTIPADGYLIVARAATRAAFQTFWGVTLGSNVTFVDSAGAMPVINGDETYTLRNAGGTVEDGPTIAMAAAAGQSIRRTDPCGAANSAGSWAVGATTTADPGSGAAAGCGTGVVVNELADALGTGNYVYEFVELHYDAPAAGDTTAPATAVTAPAAGATVSGTVTVTASATDAVGVTRVELFVDGTLFGTDTASPWSWSWNTTGAANGGHSLSTRAYDAAGNVGTSATVGVTVANDTTPPVTALTAPAAGATVSGTVSVTASATDASGVTRVELWLDGALLGTDTTSPYAWSWNTTTAANGSHSLQTRAYDAAGNSGVSTAHAVTVSNGTDVSGWRLTQASSTLTYTLPAGTVIPANGYLIVARNATRAAFQTFWGVTLGSNVAFVSAADALPQINGSERYTLYNAAGTKVDGATYAMTAAGGQSLRRKDPCNSAATSNSWTIGASSTATPGSGAGAGCAKGPVINEFSDALGTGNYVYEFVELHNDR